MRRRWARRGATVLAAALALSAGGIGAAPRAEAKGIRYLDEVFSQITTTKDLTYGHAVNAAGKDQTLKLDVLEPKGDTVRLRPAVVWVFGGYFKRGSKQDPYYAQAREQLAKAGYVTISIDYRLDPTLPEGLGGILTDPARLQDYLAEVTNGQHDAQAAVRWTRAHAGRYRIDPNRIAIAGHSAGGIIATLVGFNEQDPGTSGTPGVSSRVAAVVAAAGTSVPGVLVHVDPGDPPLLDVHGVVDPVVPFGPGLTTCGLTLVLGNVCEHVLDPDQQHGIFGYPQWRSFLYRWVVLQDPLHFPARADIVGLPGS